MFLSPMVGRRSGGGGSVMCSPRTIRRREDELDLILASPTTEQSAVTATQMEVGFSMPKFMGSPMTKRVVQSLRLQSSSNSYSELSSSSAVNNPMSSGDRPLLGRPNLVIPKENTNFHEEIVQTATGRILVARQGDPKKPAIVTYHDLGLNHLTNFQNFFDLPSMAPVLETFCLYHVTAPGQEVGAADLPEDFTYPTMEGLSEQVEYVLHYFGISTCVGFGVGLGANVLTRLAHRRPTMVECLILVNCNSQTAGWLEWVYHKVNIKNLKRQQGGGNVNGLPEGVVDYLIWYHFGRLDSDIRPPSTLSLVSTFRQHFIQEVNPRNLCPLLQCYMSRTDLGLSREVAANGKAMLAATRSLRPPVLNVTGDLSPHAEATVAFNGRLQPNRCTWMKIQDAGNVLEEQAAKVAEAAKLFLQGSGYFFRAKRSNTTVPSNSVADAKPQDKDIVDLVSEAQRGLI